MTRPQVLPAVCLLVLLIGADARTQTLLPFIIDASGNLQVLDAAEEVAEDAAEEPAEGTRTDAAQSEEKENGEETPSIEEKAEQPAAPPLSPEMTAFRDQVRRTVSQVYARSLNAQNNLPVEVIAFCEAFGHTAEIASGGRSSQKLNGVGAMCWNYPCGGYTLLRTDGKRSIARVGYGYQGRPAQLLAMLAQNRVPASYEIRIGDQHGTVADLVASEKLACRQGLDQSATLIGLAFYAKPDEIWQNDLDESWSVERLLQAELDRKANASSVDVIDRLMAISFALNQLEEADIVAEGLWKRAEDHVEEFHKYALELQNSDGTWHPGFFAYRGTSKDTGGSLLATGSILTWLVYSLPADRLEDQRVVRGVRYLQAQLAASAARSSATPSSSLEVVGQMKAARALSLYDARYFTPRTPKEPAEASQSAAPQQSSRSSERSSPRRG